jgi:protein involved in polysaccharide export with SLBB domain
LVDLTDSVPLAEETEAYEVDIRNAGDTATLRTFTGLTSPTVTYTAAQQTADGLTPGDPVRVHVFQMSALVGRGRRGVAVV